MAKDIILIIVVIAGPPVCGKTTIFGYLCEMLDGRKMSYQYVSTDEIKSEGGGDGENLVLQRLRSAVMKRPNFVLFDSCYATTSTAKLVAKVGVEVMAFSSVPLKDGQKGKNGQENKVLDPHYLAWCIHNVCERHNHLTLQFKKSEEESEKCKEGDNFDHIKSIVLRKSASLPLIVSSTIRLYVDCENLLSATYVKTKSGNPKIPLIAKLDRGSIDKLAEKVNHIFANPKDFAQEIVDNLLGKVLQEQKQGHITNYYRAVVFERSDIPLIEGMKCPEHPHVTQKFRTDVLEGHRLGSLHRCIIPYRYGNDNFRAYRAFPHEGFPESSHITLGVKEGSFYQAKVALEKGEGESFLEEREIIGFEILLM